MAAGWRRFLIAFDLLVIIYSGIALDTNSTNNAVSKRLKKIGNHDYIVWRVALKTTFWARFCPEGTPMKRPNLGLAWYGFDDIQSNFASFKNCSEIAKNKTGNWQDYTERLR